MMSPARNAETSAPESLAREMIERWRSGAPPDAAGFLSANPEVRDRKSLAMDLIYEEYCLRNEAGETLVPSTFCRKFPAYRQSLQRLLDVHQFLDTPLEEEKKWTWPEPGDSVLGFKLLHKLGEGAIAKVYLAQQPDLGQRRVVVKIARHGASEAKLLGKLEHPSIVPIHSVHQDAASGLTCICMPFLGTATLVDLLDLAFSKGKPPQSADILLTVARQYQPAGSRNAEEPEAAAVSRRATYAEGIVQLGVQLAEALAAAHEAGVMHRDIKPSNVLLSWNGRPMLLDFNLSTDLEMPLERVGGTVAYMAPERIRGLISDAAPAESKIDPPSDVYSLGALLYELLCGQLPSRPNAAPGKQARLEDWLQGRLTPPERLSHLNPQVDAAMEQAILRALAPEPGERYASAHEFAAALQRSLTWSAQAKRWLQRNRRAALAAMGMLLAIIALAAGVWASQPRIEDRLFAQAEQAYQRRDSQAAIDSLTLALKYRPNSEELLFARGQAYRQAKDHVLAQRDFRAVYDKTGNPEMLWLVGHCLLRQGSFIAAVGNFDLAIAGGFSTPQMQHNRALSLSRINQQDEALQCLDQLLKPELNLPLSHHLRARLGFYRLAGNQQPVPDTVQEDIKAALGGISGNPLIHLDAACIYNYPKQSSPDEKEALRQLRLAVQAGLNPLQLKSEYFFLGKLPDKLTQQERDLVQSRPSKPLTVPLYFEPPVDFHLASRP